MAETAVRALPAKRATRTKTDKKGSAPETATEKTLFPTRIEDLSHHGRTLFTSDWHIGADTWGVDRREELANSISALSEAGARAGVQNVIIGGDVFDSFRYPGREDLRFAASLLSGFFNIPSVRRVIVVEGNHDWNDIGVWPDIAFPVTGHSPLGESARKEFIVAESPSWVETESGYLSLVPHIRRHAVRGSFEETIRGAVPDQVPPAPILLCAHMALQGTMPELDMEGAKGEPQMTPEALSMFGKNLKGAFFGHIHKVQEYTPGLTRSAGTPGLARSAGLDYGIPCRYIGTPIKVSFSEEKHRNGGWIADFSGSAVFVEAPARELITVRGSTRAEVEKLLSSMSDENDLRDRGSESPYIRVVIDSGEKISPEEIGILVPDLAGEVVSVNSRKDRDRGGMEERKTLPADQLSRETISVPGILADYFGERAPDPETAQIFASIGQGLLRGERVETLWETMKEAGKQLSTDEPDASDEPETSLQEGGLSL